MKDGLVPKTKYEIVVKSSKFRQIEKYSNKFIKSASPFMGKYKEKWVLDSLHQWSRQWEYPYIIEKASELKPESIAVDLGSGVSFLPYYLKGNKFFKEVIAFDYDNSLSAVYDKINASMPIKVKFVNGDLRHLQLKPNSIDFAYSVSVLEHTDNFNLILNNIYQILKPGGKLSVTFDISLDNKDDISIKKAKELIGIIRKVFKEEISFNLDQELKRKDLYTTKIAALQDKSLLPWRYPILNVIKPIKKGKIGSMYKNLTVCCLTVRKPA